MSTWDNDEFDIASRVSDSGDSIESLATRPTECAGVFVGSLFRGWKRKVGWIALISACFVAALWARTFVIRDVVTLPMGQSTLKMISYRQRFYAIIYMEFTPGHQIRSFDWSVEPARIGLAMPWGDDNLLLPFDDRWKWRVRLWGFEICTQKKASVYDRRALLLPYLWLCIPLAILSSWGLLSKSRRADPVEPHSTMPNL